MEPAKEDSKLFCIFCFKNSDYVVNIVPLRMNPNELEGFNIKRNYKVRDGESQVKLFTYWKPFELNFLYLHQVYNRKKRRHYHIALDKTWATKFWPDCNFSCFFHVMKVNIALASGQLETDRNIIPTFAFWGHLAIYCMEILLEKNKVIMIVL